MHEVVRRDTETQNRYNETNKGGVDADASGRRWEVVSLRPGNYRSISHSKSNLPHAKSHVMRHRIERVARMRKSLRKGAPKTIQDEISTGEDAGSIR